MKRIGVVMVAFIAVFMISSSKPAKYKMELMETIEVSDVHTLTFLKLVGDWRCPKGTKCVQEGDAHIDLLLVSEEKDSIVFDLHTHQDFHSDTLVDGLRISLSDVSPYPKKGQARNQKDYEIAVVVYDERGVEE